MPAVEFQSRPWTKSNPGRVILKRLVWVRYGHVDQVKAHQFALDFGLVECHRTAEPECIYYRGYNDQPVVYISQKTEQPMFFGAAMEAETEEDLFRAAKLPGAGPMQDSEYPGGGRIVSIRDPDGIPFHVVFGYATVSETAAVNGAAVYNQPRIVDDEKPRRGVYQRIAKGPAAVYKLGHIGHVSPDIAKIAEWYMTNFNIRAMDVQADMKDESQDFAIFYCLDRGQHFSDHHCFFHFQLMPEQKYPGPHHASFEVHDFDVQLQGHYHLKSQGYELMWGVGRHLLGSQIFDYWYDTEGFILEHYADGDVVNEDNLPARYALSRDEYTTWGAQFNNVHGAYTGDPRPPVKTFT